jgi:hypothetical protein
MKFVVMGVGAIGSNLLVQLAKRFPDAEFEAHDYDRVEERNIKTQAYFLEHVGHPKVIAVKAVIQRFLRKPNFRYYFSKVEKKIETPDDNTLVLDCFDNVASRNLLIPSSHTLERLDCNVIHLGFSPQYSSEFIWNKDYEVPGDVDASQGDICSAQDAVPFIHLFVNLACLEIARWVDSKEKRNFVVTQKQTVRYL